MRRKALVPVALLWWGFPGCDSREVRDNRSEPGELIVVSMYYVWSFVDLPSRYLEVYLWYQVCTVAPRAMGCEAMEWENAMWKSPATNKERGKTKMI